MSIAHLLLVAGIILAPPARAADKPAEKPTTRPINDKIPNTKVELHMIRVPGGEITLTGEDGKAKTYTLKPFLIQQTESVWEEWDVMYFGQELTLDNTKDNPESDRERRVSERRREFFDPEPSPEFVPDCGWGHDGSPVIRIHHHAIGQYIAWLNKTTRKKYRFPTEAEWEYACRAGSPKALAPTKDELKKVAWFDDNAEDTTHPVAKKAPNAWGLYDMLGNVAEYVIADGETKPHFAAGGSFQDNAKDVFSGAREAHDPKKWQRHDPASPVSQVWLWNGQHVGFRLVRDPEPGE